MANVFPTVSTLNQLSDSVGLADDNNLAWQKYNAHEHIRTVVPDFRAYPLAIGDPVYIYDRSGNEVFTGADPAVINYITGTQIRLTKSTTSTLSPTTLYYKAPRGNSSALLIFGVETTQNSQVISFALPTQTEDFQQLEGRGLPGFISQKQLEALVTHWDNYNLSFATDSTVAYLGGATQQAAWLHSLTYFYDNATGFDAQLKLYDPDNTQHDIADPATWDNYGAEVSITQGNGSVTFVPAVEVFTNITVYPADRPTKPLPIDGQLALVTSVAPPAAARLALTLHYNKVL